MTDQTSGQSDAAAETLLIRGEDGAYAVPVAVLERHRIPEERRAQLQTTAPEGSTGRQQAVETPLYELPPDALAPYRLPDAERSRLEEWYAQQVGGDAEGFARYAPGQPKGEAINGYTGYAYSVTFGRMERGQSGRSVFIGVFPMFQMPLDPPAQPGMGLR